VEWSFKEAVVKRFLLSFFLPPIREIFPAFWFEEAHSSSNEIPRKLPVFANIPGVILPSYDAAAFFLPESSLVHY